MGMATAVGGGCVITGGSVCPLRVPMGDKPGSPPSPPTLHPHTPLGSWEMGWREKKKNNPLEHLKHRRFFCISKGDFGTSRKRSKASGHIQVFPGLASLCFDTPSVKGAPRLIPFVQPRVAICSCRCFTLPLSRISARLGSLGGFLG